MSNYYQIAAHVGPALWRRSRRGDQGAFQRLEVGIQSMGRLARSAFRPRPSPGDWAREGQARVLRRSSASCWRARGRRTGQGEGAALLSAGDSALEAPGRLAPRGPGRRSSPPGAHRSDALFGEAHPPLGLHLPERLAAARPTFLSFVLIDKNEVFPGHHSDGAEVGRRSKVLQLQEGPHAHRGARGVRVLPSGDLLGQLGTTTRRRSRSAARYFNLPEPRPFLQDEGGLRFRFRQALLIFVLPFLMQANREVRRIEPRRPAGAPELLTFFCSTDPGVHPGSSCAFSVTSASGAGYPLRRRSGNLLRGYLARLLRDGPPHVFGYRMRSGACISRAGCGRRQEKLAELVVSSAPARSTFSRGCLRPSRRPRSCRRSAPAGGRGAEGRGAGGGRPLAAATGR